jgi:hypothetical protein
MKYWTEAILTANHVLNRCNPRSINGSKKTPFEWLFERKPNLDYLRVFGCVAYVHIPQELRNKLEARAHRGAFLGYVENGHGFKILLQDGSIITSRDVHFIESECGLRSTQGPEDLSAWTALFLPQPLSIPEMVHSPVEYESLTVSVPIEDGPLTVSVPAADGPMSMSPEPPVISSSESDYHTDSVNSESESEYENTLPPGDINESSLSHSRYGRERHLKHQNFKGLMVKGMGDPLSVCY